MDYDDPTLFDGIRFFLAGFNPLNHDQAKARLVSAGGVCIAKYSPDCTHVIVHDLTFDDPICVAARRDKKVLVTSLWIDHSIEEGALADVSSVMYRPLKDLHGIPGAAGFVICLTGYPKVLREDIKTMTELMGAEFSKSLIPTKVTHLICYKFEGEKYVAAKRLPKIKLINHHWLEDCLKAWTILSEEDYSQSSYELEMMEAQVNDSEDETEDIAARITDHRVMNGIPTIHNETGRSLENPPVATKVELPSLQGISSNVNRDDVRLPLKPELVSESIHLQKIENPSPMRQNNGEKYVRKTPVKSGCPLFDVEDFGNVSGPNSKQSADIVTHRSSPLNSREKNQSSVVYEGKPDSSSGKTKERLESTKVRNASESVGALKPIGFSEVDADKHSASSSKRCLRRPSLSLGFEARQTIPEERLQEDYTEKATRDQGACNIETYKLSVDFVEVSNAKAGLPDGEGPVSLHQMKPLADNPDGSHTTPKSHKLMTSGSKRIDVANPATPVSTSLKENDNGSHNISGNTASKTDFSSVKSSVKNITTSRSLPFEKLQDSLSNVMDVQISPTSGNAASSGAKNKKDQPQKLPVNASYSPEFKKLAASKSGDLELNSDEKTGSSGSKPPRKKMTARKTTLGCRPKLSKKVAAHKNAALNLAGQINGKYHTNSSVTGEVMAPHTVEGSATLEGKTLQDHAFDISDYTKPFNGGPNEDEVTNSPSDKTCKQKILEAKLKGMERAKQSLPPKKGIFEQAEESVASTPKEVVVDLDGKFHKKKESVKGHTLAATGKKRHGDQLVKEPVQVEKETATFIDPGSCNNSKRISNLASKKRRGTLLLNKTDTPIEVENEIGLALDKDGQHVDKDGQYEGDKQPEKTSGISKSTDFVMEIENENGPTAVNGRSTNNGLKHTGKKRRGTLLLSKPKAPTIENKENTPTLDNSVGGDDQCAIKPNKGKKIAGKKRRGTLVLGKADKPAETEKESEKENEPVFHDHEDNNKGEALTSDLTVKSDSAVSTDTLNTKSVTTTSKEEPACFIVSGHRLQRKEYQQLIKRLKGKHCRDSHQWSYQATHFVVPDPIRRTEKFFAAAASGRWILKTDYLAACSQAGKFLPEESYEWHKNGLTEDGAINLEAPRKWRLLREKTGHGALYGLRIVVYGECIAPPLDTLKRAVKAGDGTILATSPPYNRFLKSGLDFAVVSPGITRADIWIQEFLRHEIPCVSADYLVEYVCKPGYPLDRHVQYNTHEWAAKSFSRLSDLSTESIAEAATPEDEVGNDLACQVCGFTDREDVMLVCGDESGSTGCGVGTHIDCCDPPLEDVPEEDWFCPKCTESKTEQPATAASTKKAPSKRR